MSLGTPTQPPAITDYPRLSGYTPAGFWRRLFAFAIDAALTLIACFALTQVFQRTLVHSLIPAPLLSFAVATSYFAVFGSNLVKGQTLGMMATKVKVVARDGSTISLRRSFLRYAILFAPLLLRSPAPAETPSMIKTGYEIVLALVACAAIYLSLFNRGTGQSLQDLATDTFVVDSSGGGPVCAAPFWRPHWVFLLGLAALNLALAPTMLRSWGEAESIQNSISRTTGATAEVEVYLSAGHSQIIVKTGCDQISEDRNKAAARIAAAVLNGDARAGEHDYIEIDCVKTLDVGLVKNTTSNSIVHTPQEWRALIQN